MYTLMICEAVVTLAALWVSLQRADQRMMKSLHHMLIISILHLIVRLCYTVGNADARMSLTTWLRHCCSPKHAHIRPCDDLEVQPKSSGNTSIM